MKTNDVNKKKWQTPSFELRSTRKTLGRREGAGGQERGLGLG